MTVHFKLTMAVIAVILVANCLVSVVTVRRLTEVWLNEVQDRVRSDLSLARAAYSNHAQRIAAVLRGGAVDLQMPAPTAGDEAGQLRARLQALRSAGGFDLLWLVDRHGTVLARAHNAVAAADPLTTNALVARTLKDERPASGTLILTAEQLQREDESLARRARIPVIDTPAAKPTRDTFRDAGMVLAATAPIFAPDGSLAGVLLAGDLLNRRYEIVDHIKREVFPEQTDQGRKTVTVTIFQGDLRISTNVLHADGRRAIGTRLSAAVADEVLDAGRMWAKPAFVVNDWYITAYEPIRDPDDRIIGSLYVGLLQAPFEQRRNALVGLFLGVVSVATVVSLVLIFVVGALVLRPIKQIIAMHDRILAGDRTARVGLQASGEMGRLCAAVDGMADALAEREDRLRQAARQQIGRSEQLASVGRLAAGVAHEINNPLTGVLTFACMLREKTNLGDEDRSDLDLIIRETTRAAAIVRGLLDFARERQMVRAPFDVNEVVRQTVRLLGNREALQRIIVVENLPDGLPQVYGDANQIQQVILNLALNACEAMSDSGTLLLTTLARDGQVVVEVSDTGCGIKPEDIDKIFEPFYTTKPVGKGTGLGLSVSYGIVQQHGGKLEVESQEGKGSKFTVVLPVSEAPVPAGIPAEAAAADVLPAR